MAINRSLDALHPEFRKKILEWLVRCVKEDIPVRITETLRTKETQAAYYAQGRKPLKEVNELRKIAGLPPITEEDNKKRVTWTLESPHMYGLAIDFVIIKNNAPDWNDINSYTKAGTIAESLGLEWGGRWRTPDYPHIQMKNWQSFIRKN